MEFFYLIKIVSTIFFNFNLFFRLAEGEMALTGGCLTNSKPLETIASEFGSAAGYGLALLGQICRFVFFQTRHKLYEELVNVFFTCS